MVKKIKTSFDKLNKVLFDDHVIFIETKRKIVRISEYGSIDDIFEKMFFLIISKELYYCKHDNHIVIPLTIMVNKISRDLSLDILHIKHINEFDHIPLHNDVNAYASTGNIHVPKRIDGDNKKYTVSLLSNIPMTIVGDNNIDLFTCILGQEYTCYDIYKRIVNNKNKIKLTI